MISAYVATPYFKALHIAALCVWMACLFGLPFLLALHRGARGQRDFSRVRRFAHFSYIGIATPSAVIAVATGTALIFLRNVFEPWLYLKLVLVGLLVCLHGFLGHLNVKVGEERGEFRPPRGLPIVAGVTILSTLILVLVLGKPDLMPLTPQLPDWLLEPLGNPLPVDEVPI